MTHLFNTDMKVDINNNSVALIHNINKYITIEHTVLLLCVIKENEVI